MDKNAKIYVAGHTGMIGSAVVRRLQVAGYNRIVTKPRQELDLTGRRETERFFAETKPDCVFLCAAKVGGIGANRAYPADYIFQNLLIQTSVMDAAYRHNAKKLLFLATPCLYPKDCPQPMKEEHILAGPLEQTSEPFAVAKIAGVRMCQSYNKQYGTRFLSVIPANGYGVNDHFDEGGHAVAALMAKLHEAKINEGPSVSVWGTGAPRREFIYVDDIADALIFLMNEYDGSEVINVGTGRETSIGELVKIIGKTAQFEGKIEFDHGKPDGNPRRFLDSSKISSMGWKPKISLEEGLRITYEWFTNRRGQPG
ncbi:MAG: GDP-L-fucose synthase [Nitrospinae bacterium]|nr:GDP-L-fucose synthase [Nitrospinota bacterium]